MNRQKKTQNIFTIPFPISVIRSLLIALGKPLYYTTAFLLLYAFVFFGLGIPFLIRILISKIPHISFHFWTKKSKTNIAPVSSTLTFRPAWRFFLQTFPSFAGGLVLSGMIIGSGVGFYDFVLKDLPSPKDLINRQPPLTTKIYDRNGELLYKLYKSENRTLVSLSTIPVALKQATIAIEDKDFYNHNGFSIKGIVRAAKADLEGKRIQGGSTITQQLVKNTLLTTEKTMKRKVRELILSFMVETSLSKDEILEMYFNEVSFGGTVHGVEEASRRYFGKSVKELSLGESAYLAGLPQAPSTYSPFGPNPQLGFVRQHQVLQRMFDDGYITQEQVAQAKEEKIIFQPDITDIKAPHFVMYVRELLATEYGEDIVAQGGLEVYTTLDYQLQKKAEEAVNAELEKLKNMHVTNGAVIVTNPKTGEILAMVGSRNYFDVAHDGQVNVTLRPRQPGSSIKPLTYAAALEKGFTPSTVIEDAPITYKVLGSPPYTPKNYDGKYHGKVTVRTALANSFNIPAVKVLAAVGIQHVIEKGRSMGLTTWGEENSSRFGLSLTLGGGEVLMADMAKLYGTFANFGLTTDLYPLLKVKDHQGKILYQHPCTDGNETPDEERPCLATRTLDPRVAWQITNILSDNVARSTAFGLRSVLYIPNQEVAVKTGTTNSLRDNWTIGYTNNRLVASWVGNNDNSAMSYVASGITGASPIWNIVMKNLLDEKNPHHFATPSGLIKVKVCIPTGTLGCNACPVQRDDYFVPGTEPKQACTEEMFKKKEEVTQTTTGSIGH